MKFKRQRYQSGSLSRETRKAGPAVWIFRWREGGTNGRVNRKTIIGSIQDYPSKAAAKRAVQLLRLSINAENPAGPVQITVRQLAKHYEQNELTSKAFSTQRTVQTALKSWVFPKWAEYNLSAVRTVDVESWLHCLPLANATKAKIRNVMHIIFTHACRHEWAEKNPISLVRQSAKREKLPDVLELEELKQLIAALKNPARALVFLTAATGLRVSEALGLQWSDISFITGEIQLRRAVVHQHIGSMKTEASHKPVPVGGALLETLQSWKSETIHREQSDWVFASNNMGGVQPYWPETLMKCYVQPEAKRLGIAKSLGWHSFRRTFATLLNGYGENVKTVQELMRHANSRLTLDVYAQALTPEKRAAHLRLVRLIEPAAETADVPLCSHAQNTLAVSA